MASTMDQSALQEFIPRNYQIQLMQIAFQQNTVIYLPTGSGKTFIALMTLKLMSEPLSKPYGQGGKISVLLVNTVALVAQHAKYFEKHTVFKVGKYTGEMNLDFWPRDKWYEEYDKYNILIMTSQIFLNLITNNYIDLNKINLLIFDECHHAVNNHSMRQVMMTFKNLHSPPRVLGLTATLLNGNCKPHKVVDEVKTLETTFHGKVATVDELEDIIGFSTNPTERIKLYDSYIPFPVDQKAVDSLESVIFILQQIKIENENDKVLDLKRLNNDTQNMKKLENLLRDCILHIQMFGTFGGYISAICYKIQMVKLKMNCTDNDTCNVFLYVITILTYVERIFELQMKDIKGKDKILKYSSDRIRALFSIFDEFQQRSQEELCGIIFAERRFTCKILHHILAKYGENDPTFPVKSDFLVGYQNNPYNNTRESLYITKKNKQVIESFIRKEVNILCSSKVLEEGIDIPRCSLVVAFDKPVDYRSYIQSKGRARHKSSLYYIMVDKNETEKYLSIFRSFQEVETILNTYLIGKNQSRDAPSADDLENMYSENILPYYVDGPNSAQVNMLSAIPLLCQYCQSLPCDIYTQHAPDWYLEEEEEGEKLRVVLLMPTICPLTEPIKGNWMQNKKDAKRAAALKACIILHQIGELDDHLLPIKHVVTEDDFKFLFSHYPEIKESDAGTNSRRRLHKKMVADCIKGPIQPNQPVYLHVINLKPNFLRKEDLNVSSFYDVYVSPCCFGLISSKPLPVICDFPTYTSLGCVDVNMQVNHSKIILKDEDLKNIKEFHFLVFNDVLEIFNKFLAFDTSKDAETLLLVPFNKLLNRIDCDILRRHYTIFSSTDEMSTDQKMNIEVTQESYLKTIVSPVYRNTGTYLVTEVSLNRSPLSEFPNESFGNFVDYYQQKHNIIIENKNQPLLLVKGISKRLNLIKPRGISGIRKRKKCYDEMLEYLIPELVVKQEFPADLWIKSTFLPTILTRIVFLLKVEELRSKIAKDTRLGQVTVNSCRPIEVDAYLLDYDAALNELEKEPIEKLNTAGLVVNDESVYSELNLKIYNKDYCTKLMEAEFPWKDIEEPKDIERNLAITTFDIQCYDDFISAEVTEKERQIISPFKKKPLAITYYELNYLFKDIQFLNIPFNNQGPELREVYTALTTSKANDVVNLERLETLGDSFLKFISTLYITLRFPDFNEGKATSLKGRMVSNKNLYYLAAKKNLGGIMRYSDLAPKEKWVPPAFSAPESIIKQIISKEISISTLFNINIPREEQISGNLNQLTANLVHNEEDVEEIESCLHSACEFLKHQYIGDKHVSDVVESIIGLYFQKTGIVGATKIVEWFGIIPKSEKILQLMQEPPKNPILGLKSSSKKLDFFLTQSRDIEKNLGYVFKNRGFLLQAVTHGSYSINRITRSYETLEFLGDAILDFLITCHIFESCGHLNPGQLTDLRSALVNNNTFASLTVRYGFHKSLLMMNADLQRQIDKFASYLETKNYEIDDEVIILLEEDDINMAEFVDVPKILGDVFEALVGAIYLDSDKNLNLVWKVVHRIMYKEIEIFSKNVPKNVIRKLYETPGLYPKFSDPIPVNKKIMVGLQYLLQGRQKVVYGFGSNKAMAKKAAAKIALRSLNL